MKKTSIQPRPSVSRDYVKTRFQTQNFQSHFWLAMTMVWLLTLGPAVAQTNLILLLSARNPSVSLPTGGDGDSIAPAITPDGRYEVFSSVANDLAPGGNGRFALNIYLRDRTAQTTTLVSANTNGTGGGNDNSMNPQVSSNGQFVVFQSDASDLVSNDTNVVTDIFMRNVTSGTTTLVSVAPDGTPGNGASTDPVMTPDGRYVAFISAASNLVAGDTNGMPDVFVRDMLTQTTSLISVGATASTLRGYYYPNGIVSRTNMATPVITPDGRYVAFFSSASNLVAGVPPFSDGEVYVRDRLAGMTIWASTNSATIGSNYFPQADILSYRPRLSDDGQTVVFKTSTNSYGSASEVSAVIVQYNVATGTTTVINVNGIGTDVGLDDDNGPEITPDGEFVAYVRCEGNISSNYSSVHVWDSEGAVDTLVSDPGSNGVITTTSTQPVLSAEGWYVAFLSNATNFSDDSVLSGFHLYLRNYLEGSLQLVDEDTNGVGSTDNQLALFSLSRYGRYVAFDSQDGSLVSGDNNHAYDVFTRDLFSDTTEMDSSRNAAINPQTGDNISMSQVSVSTNGQWVAFASVADNLVPNDTNNEPDVFVRDLLAGTTTLVSAGANGGPAWDSPSLSPIISGNGRYVIFVSAATNLVAGQGVTTSANIFRRDLQTASTVLVSVSTNGVDAANGDCYGPAISQDGRYVAFLSSAGNLPGRDYRLPSGTYTTYLCDLSGGMITALTNGAVPTMPIYSIFPPSISANGRYVAYSSYMSSGRGGGGPSQLRIWDDQLGMDVYTNSYGPSSAVLNANGTRVLYSATASLTLADDIMTGTNVFTFNYPIMIWGAGGFSADGRYVAFVAETNTQAQPPPWSGTNIYLCDLQNQTITLVSSNFIPFNGTSGSADAPVISADGRFVVYRGCATGIVPGDYSPAPNIYRYDSLLGTTSNLTVGQAGLSPFLWDSRPAVNSDGGTVAFLSLGSGLASPDLNRAPDAFAFAMDIGMPLDSDGDGIPDWWMIQYFGHPTGQAGDNSLAQDDADGTGMSNLQKYLIGLNPTNPVSLFRITSINLLGVNTLISWQAGGGRTNLVQAAAVVSGPYTNISPALLLPGSGDVFTNYLDTTTNQSTRFYRIKLGP